MHAWQAQQRKQKQKHKSTIKKVKKEKEKDEEIHKALEARGMLPSFPSTTTTTSSILVNFLCWSRIRKIRNNAFNAFPSSCTIHSHAPCLPPHPSSSIIIKNPHIH